MSVWVMPSVDVCENFLKQPQAVAGGGHPQGGNWVRLQCTSGFGGDFPSTKVKIWR